MDVVEAIDAWIDEQIDDLTDDELEIILEILDAIAASPLATVDADDVYGDDVDELVGLAGGSADDRAYTNTVLRAALFGESVDAEADDGTDPQDIVDQTDTQDEDSHAFPADDDLDLTEELDLNVFLAEDDLDSDQDNDAFPADELDDSGDDDHADQELDVADEFDDDEVTRGGGLHGDFLSDLADAQFLDGHLDADGVGHDDVGHDDFLADLAKIVRPVELREYDELGPTFLTEVSQAPVRTSRRQRRRLSGVLWPAFMIIGLAAFAFGMVQLLGSLDEEDPATNLAANADQSETTATPEPAAPPTEVPAPPTRIDPSAPTPTPTAEPTPAPRIGIRLVTGDVMVAAFPEPGGPPEVAQLYDVSDNDLAPARQLAWLSEGLGIVDSDGNVLIVDPDARRPKATLIYEVGGGFGEAVKIASVNGMVAILTEDGDIHLTPSNGRADPDVIQIVWDAEEEGVEATDLTAVGGLVPFVLSNGNAQMIVTSSDNAIVPIWVADEQPPAFNVSGSASGVLLGVGQGAVARYSLDPDGNRLESVWDPFTREDEPAIGYSSAGDGTAIVTGNGAIVLADESGGGTALWDPEVTEIRAFIALGTDSQVVVLLETGSVVRIPLDPDGLIESIWDITDETLDPANQIIVEPIEPAEG